MQYGKKSFKRYLEAARACSAGTSDSEVWTRLARSSDQQRHCTNCTRMNFQIFEIRSFETCGQSNCVHPMIAEMYFRLIPRDDRSGVVMNSAVHDNT